MKVRVEREIPQTRSASQGSRRFFITASTTTLITIKMNETQPPPVARPRAVPAAGGCSVSVITIKNILVATARELNRIKIIWVPGSRFMR